MPYNIVVLSEEAILCNPVFDTILPIAIVLFALSFLVILIMIGFSFDIFSTFGGIILDFIFIIWGISAIFSLISIIGIDFPYEDTGRKKYSIVAQTEEQIEYIYDNYDITGSDGDIYYIEERDD